MTIIDFKLKELQMSFGKREREIRKYSRFVDKRKRHGTCKKLILGGGGRKSIILLKRFPGFDRLSF
jgi:hypothetical protein